MDEAWSLASASEVYRHKLIDVPQILADWYQPFGGIAGRNILEFGCGEGIMALGLALLHEPAAITGVEVLDVYQNCLPFAQKNIALSTLPPNLRLEQILPGQTLAHLGRFDFVYSWSVFEHVSQDLLATALASVASVLKPNGVFMLQISPLYYSAFGSHLAPWILAPWAHLSMQDEAYKKAFFEAPDASPEIMESWTVYFPKQSTRSQQREQIWNTYQTLNKITAPQLERLVKSAGLKIVRDYRTPSDHPIPKHVADIYSRDVLLVEQVVWLLQRAF